MDEDKSDTAGMLPDNGLINLLFSNCLINLCKLSQIEFETGHPNSRRSVGKDDRS